jgi:hypothetical protein
MSKSNMISWALAGSMPELTVAMVPWRKSFLMMSAAFTPVVAERSLMVKGAAILTLPPISAGVACGP